SGGLYFPLCVTETPLALLRAFGRLQTTCRSYVAAAQGLEISKRLLIGLLPVSRLACSRFPLFTPRAFSQRPRMDVRLKKSTSDPW
ncbi:hypothetical protein JTM08_34915, partial [Pseudomonas aeruginosa]|nr:hypothetical protein [Pseudomonas aeruginosa]